VSERDGSTALRRFAGPVADELAILSRSDDASCSAGQQAEAAYRALADSLAAAGASFREVVSERVFLRDAGDPSAVLAARARVLRDAGGNAPAPTSIGQPPVDGGALEVIASVLVPRDRSAWSVENIPPDVACGCEGCRGSGARLVVLGDETVLHTANLYGCGAGAYEQAWEAFRAAERLLERSGMTFRDVVRTWIHLRDIDRDYDALNRARREFFARSGIELRPASTGIGGAPWPSVHSCSLSFHAVKSARPLEVTGMSTPLLNEAWSYGADFSRGLRVVEANKTALHVSGTASIDEAGRTAHVAGFEAQAERMLENIASLLDGQGARFSDLVSGVTYLRHASDAAVFRAAARRRGFDGFPCAVVEAALCRPELLCEAEVVAMLPGNAAGA